MDTVFKSSHIYASWRHMLLLLAAICLLAGCSSEEDRKARHLARAERYVAEKSYKDAVLEYKNVLQMEPANDAVHFQLAETYLRMKEIDLAAQSYADAARHNIDNMDAHLKLGRILIMARKTMGARKAAKTVLRKYPDHVLALQLLAAAQFQENNLAGAIMTLQKAAGINPKDTGPRLFLAEIFAASGDMDAAASSFLEAISVDPANPKPYIKLARLYGERNQWEKVFAVLNQMGPAAAKGYRLLGNLAQFCESNQKWELAEQIFSMAARVAPNQDAGPLVDLGAHYGRSGKFQKALAYMQRALSIRENDPTILASIANLHIELNNEKAAVEAIDRALEIAPGHALANYAQGRMAFRRKNFSQALLRFDEVIRKNPAHAMAYYYKALCQLGKGTREQSEEDLFRAAAGLHDDEDSWILNTAQANLRMALELDPKLIKARLVLANIYLSQRDTPNAREQIEAALALAPGFLKTVALLGSLKILEGDLEGAETVCKKVLEKRPNASIWHARLGIIYTKMKRLDEALLSYRNALEFNPLYFEALKSMVGIHLQRGEFETALIACTKQQSLVGGDRKLVARIKVLEGTIFLAMKDFRQAIGRFQEATTAAPDLIAPRMSLAEAYLSQERLDEAAAEYEAVLEHSGEHLPACMALGYIHYKKGSKRAAENYYRRALKIKEGYGPAANNLAYIIAGDNEKLHEAYRLAQLAERKMPRDASAKDTLGWLYYRVGDYSRAISKLEESLKLAPDNPRANYHMGLAYYQNKEFEKSRVFLKKALELDPDFEGADDARTLLD